MLALSVQTMSEDKSVKSLFTSKYSQSYQMQGTNSAEDCGLSGGSTSVARQSGNYGANASRGETTVDLEVEASGDFATDKTHLLSEKIRQKKQGRKELDVAESGEGLLV